ncbi:MAG TPA: fluoride efflux transporter CrcB [Lentimicrobium sp.]|nr:fluoride efflux transporter CrcB [Lentimicrobium sp.]
MLKILLFIGAGSFLGGVSRFLTTRYIQNAVLSGFPYGTLVVNILGCFIIGFLFGLADKGSLNNTEWKLFLTVGFCGGFTTFSAFSLENMMLLRDGAWFHFMVYTLLSIVLGLLATVGGYSVTKLYSV